MNSAPSTQQSTPSTALLSARGIQTGYGNNVIIDDLDLDIERGCVTTVIGPNGCGKSTLLRCLGRLLPAKKGSITFDGKDVAEYSTKELATRLGILPQSPNAPEGLLVSDLVSRGRHPHQRWYRQWSSDDEDVVIEALRRTHVEEFADRAIDQLSGGQRQRVWIAMALAQETEAIFLDEPTTYLDLSHSIEVLELVSQLSRSSEEKRTVVMVLHDLNLAVRYSDQLVVMKDGSIITTGAPKDVITPELLAEVFGLNALVIEDPVTGGPLIVPQAPREMNSRANSSIKE